MNNKKNLIYFGIAVLILCLYIFVFPLLNDDIIKSDWFIYPVIIMSSFLGYIIKKMHDDNKKMAWIVTILLLLIAVVAVIVLPIEGMYKFLLVFFFAIPLYAIIMKSFSDWYNACHEKKQEEKKKKELEQRKIFLDDYPIFTDQDYSFNHDVFGDVKVLLYFSGRSRDYLVKFHFLDGVHEDLEISIVSNVATIESSDRTYLENSIREKHPRFVDNFLGNTEKYKEILDQYNEAISNKEKIRETVISESMDDIISWVEDYNDNYNKELLRKDVNDKFTMNFSNTISLKNMDYNLEYISLLCSYSGYNINIGANISYNVIYDSVDDFEYFKL